MRSSLSPQHWGSCTGLSVLILLTLLSHVCLTEQKTASFSKNDDSNFQKLVLHEETRAMFLGAQNKLYRLSLDLKRQQEVSLGPANDSHLCLNPKHECMYELKLRDEQVKLLLASPVGDELLMCGNLYQGSCAKVAAHNITQLTWVYEPVVGVESDTVFSSTAAVVTKDDTLFVANSVNTHANNQDDNMLGTTRPTFLATRNYSTLGIRYRTQDVSSQMNINASIMVSAIHRFAFTYNDSAYFLVTRESEQNSDEAAAFISRTCQTDTAYHSYVEAQLSCNKDGIQFNFVEDAYVGTPGRHLAEALRIHNNEELLFVTFSNQQKSRWDCGRYSSLCVYRLADIHKNLTQSIQNCFNGEGSTGPYHLAHPSSCTFDNPPIQDDYCGESNINFPVASKTLIEPIISRAFTKIHLTAVTMSAIGPYTVVYLGTCDGYLIKVEVNSAGIIYYHRISIQPGNTILPDMLLSPDHTSLYAMTSSKVVRVEVLDCGSHGMCKTCMENADPPCGWCSASKRCTTEDACQRGLPGWTRTRTGRCPATTQMGISPQAALAKQQKSPMDNSSPSVLAIVTIIIIFVVFNLAIAASTIFFIVYLLIICLWHRCRQLYEEQLSHSTTQNRVVEETENIQMDAAAVVPSSVPMDEAMLQSLLKDITDPQLQETVKVAFIPRSHLQLQNEIGKGHFGCVYTGLLQLREKENVKVRVAVKTLRDYTLDHKDAVESFLQEGVMTKDLDHPHVLRLLGVSVSDQDKNPLLILPYMAQGDLHNYITKKKKKNFTWQYLLQLGQQVAQGMAYLAEHRIIHRDLAARNCMMDENSQVKVADFGLSKKLYDKKYYVSQNHNRKLPVRWMALESLKDCIFTTESDVWSFGVLLWELMTRGDMPYTEVYSNNILDYLASGHRLKKPENCAENVYTLMCKCWQTSPNKRPTFTDLVKQLELIGNQHLYSNFQFPSSHNRLSRHSRKSKCSPGRKVSDLFQVK